MEYVGHGTSGFFVGDCNSNLMKPSNRTIGISEELLVSLRERVILIV